MNKTTRLPSRFEVHFKIGKIILTKYNNFWKDIVFRPEITKIILTSYKMSVVTNMDIILVPEIRIPFIHAPRKFVSS